jgi:hypothetical protein
MIRAQLAAVEIPCVTKGPIAPQLGVAGACDIYVEDHLAARAREALVTPQFSDEELARLSEEAGREYGTGSPGG